MNTSPNMRSLRAAVLYPGIGMLEFTNISVGRGTDTPFEVMGAPWIRRARAGRAVNAANRRACASCRCGSRPTPANSPSEECGGLNFIITDWDAVPLVRPGPDVASALRKLHRDEWEPERWMRLLGNQEVYDRVWPATMWRRFSTSINEQTSKFRERRKQFELYE